MTERDVLTVFMKLFHNKMFQKEAEKKESYLKGFNLLSMLVHSFLNVKRRLHSCSNLQSERNSLSPQHRISRVLIYLVHTKCKALSLVIKQITV